MVLSDGRTVHLRPIKPSDSDAINALHHRLSDETIYLRFFGPLPNLSPVMLARFVNVDYQNRMALVAELGDQLIGVARYDRLPSPSGQPGDTEAEVAFLIDDAHQGRGIGTVLLEHLAAIARDGGIFRFVAETLPHNRRMLALFHEAGFADARTFADGVVKVVFPIEPTDASVDAVRERERRAAARSISRLLAPRTVAVVGVPRRSGTIGRRLLHNLLEADFAGPVYPVHPSAHAVAGVRAYPSVLDVPDEVDLAVIVVPAVEVPGVVEACARKGVGGLVVISSGFAERDPDGAAAERRLVAEARRNGMRMIGPNSMGVLNTDPLVGLNATIAPAVPGPGRIGFMSQSGGLGLVILEEMARRGLGVSTFVSVGNKADVSGNDLLEYWDGDDRTDLVLLYLESFGNPRRFARVARRFSRTKPIVAVKAGRSSAGIRAAAPAGDPPVPGGTDTVVDAVLRQSGVIRVDTLEELFDVAQVLAYQPLPAGRRVGIVGPAGGPGVLAADACDAAGLEVPELSATTQASLRALVGSASAVANPVSLDPRATWTQFERALVEVLADPAVDAVLAIFVTPLGPSADEVAAAIARAAATAPAKPVVASVLGRRLVLPGGRPLTPEGHSGNGTAQPDAGGAGRPAGTVGAGEAAAGDRDRTGGAGRPGGPVGAGDAAAGDRDRAGAAGPDVPSFSFPEAAARALARVAWYADWRLRPVGVLPEFTDLDRQSGRRLVAAALGGPVSHTGGGTQGGPGLWLDTPTAVRLLESYRIPVVATRPAGSAAEAVTGAGDIGYPVVLKADADRDHGREVVGAHVGLGGPAEVAEAFGRLRDRLGGRVEDVVVQAMAGPGYDAVVEVLPDQRFGPVLAVHLAAGGRAARDQGRLRALRVLPLTDVDAADLVASLGWAPGFDGPTTGPPGGASGADHAKSRSGRRAGGAAASARASGRRPARGGRADPGPGDRLGRHRRRCRGPGQVGAPRVAPRARRPPAQIATPGLSSAGPGGSRDRRAGVR